MAAIRLSIASKFGVTVDGNPANLVLDLRVQPGGTAAAQSLVNYGASRGVTVTIKAYP